MNTAETIYETLVDEEDALACAEIPEAACRETPRNFVLILLAQLMTKLGDSLASPKTVLPWIMAGAGAPVALTGLLVPIRESGSLIPQLVIAGWVRRLAVRKWVWVLGSCAQAVCVLGIAAAAGLLEGPTAGWTIIGCLGLFSLARGFCSVASKDVLGKTVPKKRRGRLTGWSASGAGLASIFVGLALLLPLAGIGDAAGAGALVLAAGFLWLAGAAVFSRVSEYEGETEGGRNAIVGAWHRLSLLGTDRPFRRFVITRALLLCSALSAPFYVLMAREQVGSPARLLGWFIVSAGLASLVSGPIWGRLADHSSRRVMSVAATISGLIGILVFAAVQLVPALAAHGAFFPVAYFCLAVAHDGVRVGRKTYIVDLAEGNRRTDYVSVSNSVIGVVLLLAGLTGTLSGVLSLSGVVLLLSIFGLAGAWLATRLPEV
ncbi:MAG: MFS transporter [Gammaproteobacteria bacterium]